jgi:hypothetical protein
MDEVQHDRCPHPTARAEYRDDFDVEYFTHLFSMTLALAWLGLGFNLGDLPHRREASRVTRAMPPEPIIPTTWLFGQRICPQAPRSLRPYAESHR